ncbi:MAG: ATP-binding protein [Lachnospiraceae bacterium]|nr:ATP-binding protein [Lachnospiraceae bacterium]
MTVSDTRCGIAKEDLPHIFHRSFTTSADKGGQGLGLAITHAIISEHEGTIEVSSKKGKGTTFTISLPLLT